jgi:membrane protease YdiL (CAAX protease family)
MRRGVAWAGRQSAESLEAGPAWRDAGHALVVMSCVWATLLAGPWLERVLGPDGAVLTVFGIAVLWVVLTRRRPEPIVGTVATPVGLAVGFIGLSFWLSLIAVLGLALGLPPAAGRTPAGVQPLALASRVLLSPLFEELLYRERLLPALQPMLGTPLAVLVSSACFALPHLESWSIVATFVVGLFLGGVLLWTRSIALCVAIHAGLNLAAGACGIPPTRWSLPWLSSGALSLALLWTGALGLRVRRPAAG